MQSVQGPDQARCGADHTVRRGRFDFSGEGHVELKAVQHEAITVALHQLDAVSVLVACAPVEFPLRQRRAHRVEAQHTAARELRDRRCVGSRQKRNEIPYTCRL